MTRKTVEQMIAWAEQYNDPRYFEEDPLAFPKEFVRRGSSLQDIEIAAVFASHLAWGRRSMIVRDCTRLFDEMESRPYDYVMAGSYRDDETSLHRTVKWSEAAGICGRLREWYTWHKSLESLSAKEIRAIVFRRKEDPSAPDKKINLMRRWLVRRDGKVDLGLWTNTDPASLLDMKTALEITDRFREIWPEDPLLGDFALFGYGVTHSK